MGSKGTFDLPTGNEQSTAGARRAYVAMWNREWPHDDAHLRTLAREVPPHDGQTVADRARCDHLLMRMREDHEFTPDK